MEAIRHSQLQQLIEISSLITECRKAKDKSRGQAGLYPYGLSDKHQKINDLFWSEVDELEITLISRYQELHNKLYPKD